MCSICAFNSKLFLIYISQERINRAVTFSEKLSPPCPVYADSISDETSKAYGALPDRFYAIKDGKVVFQGGPGPFHYKIAPLRNYLELSLKKSD